MRDSKRETDVKNRLLGSVGEGEGEIIWENRDNRDYLREYIETCILPYVKIDHQSKFVAWDRVLRASALG